MKYIFAHKGGLEQFNQLANILLLESLSSVKKYGTRDALINRMVLTEAGNHALAEHNQ